MTVGERNLVSSERQSAEEKAVATVKFSLATPVVESETTGDVFVAIEAVLLV